MVYVHFVSSSGWMTGQPYKERELTHHFQFLFLCNSLLTQSCNNANCDFKFYILSNLDGCNSLGNIFTYNSLVSSHFIIHPCLGEWIAWILGRLGTVLTRSRVACPGPFISFFALLLPELIAAGYPRHIPALSQTKVTFVKCLQKFRREMLLR